MLEIKLLLHRIAFSCIIIASHCIIPVVGSRLRQCVMEKSVCCYLLCTVYYVGFVSFCFSSVSSRMLTFVLNVMGNICFHILWLWACVLVKPPGGYYGLRFLTSYGGLRSQGFKPGPAWGISKLSGRLGPLTARGPPKKKTSFFF